MSRTFASLPGRDSVRRIKALIIKECHQIVRDPSSILIAFVLPLILLLLFGFGVSLDATSVKIGLVVEDGGKDAQSLAAAFASTRYFDVRTVKDRRLVEQDLVASRLRGLVVIPSDFSKRLERAQEPALVQVISDGSQPNTATFVENYARGVLSNWLVQQGYDKGESQQAPVRLEPRIWFNPELNSRYSLLPGTLAIIMAIIGTLLTSLVIAREWERGTMEALMATPAGIVEILLGKLIPYFILGMGSMLVSVTTSRLLFGLPLQGSLLWLCAASAAFLLASLAQGLLISTAAKNQFVAAQGALLSAYLPALLLSGFLFEIASMPLPIRILTHLIPARYLVSSLQTIFLAGDITAIIVPNIMVLLGMALLLLLVTARKTVKRLE